MQYIVNTQAQSNGDHEVHTTSCSHLPDWAHRMDLGWHADCQSAVRRAKQTYSRADGCFYCCRPCHTS